LTALLDGKRKGEHNTQKRPRGVGFSRKPCRRNQTGKKGGHCGGGNFKGERQMRSVEKGKILVLLKDRPSVQPVRKGLLAAKKVFRRQGQKAESRGKERKPLPPLTLLHQKGNAAQARPREGVQALPRGKKNLIPNGKQAFPSFHPRKGGRV